MENCDCLDCTGRSPNPRFENTYIRDPRHFNLQIVHLLPKKQDKAQLSTSIGGSTQKHTVRPASLQFGTNSELYHVPFAQFP